MAKIDEVIKIENEKEESVALKEEQVLKDIVQENTTKKNKKNNYSFGRRVIRIPLSKDTLNETTITRYLPFILQMHYQNVIDYRHLKGVYTGEESHIWKKTREDSKYTSNSTVEEGHPFRIVEFKKGYLYGEDVTYSYLKDTTCSDDLTYFNKFMQEQDKASKNVDISEDVFIAGSGIRFILPKKRDKTFNPRKQSPFEIYNLDYECSFIVYSSNYTKEKLFGGIITTIDSLDPNEIKYEIMLYDHQFAYIYNAKGRNGMPLSNPAFKYKMPHYLGVCNFVEYKTNKSRISIIERIETLLDANNEISSYALDNIKDFVNAILVVYNQKMSKSSQENINKNKAMLLQTNDPLRPADAKYLVNELNLSEVSTKQEAIIALAYSIAGVPLATTKSTSGGDTGEARELGGGWSSADEVAKQEEKGLIKAEREMLEICLSICKKTPNCPIDEIESSDIDIVFNRSNRDNLLVKMQALKYAYDMKLPKEASLNIVRVTSNSHEIAHQWEENDKGNIEDEQNKGLKEVIE
ncbi:MAG: phage portal protein [Longibaculum sp.]